MKNLDLNKLNNAIEKFIDDRDWDKFHSVKNLTMALSVETSELMEIVQWLTEMESNEIKNDPVSLAKVKDEVADIFVYLLRILKKTDIDIEEAVMAKLQKNAEKYPIEKSFGNAKKYNDL